jgi:hypothetical protein
MKTETEIDTKKPELSTDFYKEICNNIRVSDDISFKLLNIVPVLTGISSTALVFLEKSGLLSNYSTYAVICLSICGAVITFGLFKWELRNIQKCNWLIECAEDFELRMYKLPVIETERGLTKDELNKFRKNRIQFAYYPDHNPESSKILNIRWGKTEAEKLIYSVAIAVWFVPITIGLYKLLNP